MASSYKKETMQCKAWLDRCTKEEVADLESRVGKKMCKGCTSKRKDASCTSKSRTKEEWIEKRRKYPSIIDPYDSN